MTTKALLASVLATTAIISIPMVAAAQDTAPVPAAAAPQTTINAFPGVFGVASAIPAPGNTGFASLTYVNPRGGVAGSDGDGDLSFGYTVGNPFDNVSLTFGVTVTSLEDDFGDSGNFFLSAARNVYAGEAGATFIGASAGALSGWGDSKNDTESYSVYVSHLTAFTAGGVEYPVQFTLGYGNRTTRSTSTIGAIDEGFFAGMGFGLTQNLSASLSVTETTVNVGATATIPGIDGVAVTAGFYDVADNAQRQQFALTVGYSF